MSDTEQDELERRKLEREIEKMEAEIQTLRPSQYRSWLTSISMIVCVVVSTSGLFLTLWEIRIKNQKLAMEAEIRSHEIFLNQVLDRISGIKTEYWELRKVGKEEKLVNVKDSRYGGTTMVGAYAAAVSLAKEFPALRGPAKEALERQGGDRARKFLKELGESSPATPN